MTHHFMINCFLCLILVIFYYSDVHLEITFFEFLISHNKLLEILSIQLREKKKFRSLACFYIDKLTTFQKAAMSLFGPVKLFQAQSGHISCREHVLVVQKLWAMPSETYSAIQMSFVFFLSHCHHQLNYYCFYINWRDSIPYFDKSDTGSDTGSDTIISNGLSWPEFTMPRKLCLDDYDCIGFDLDRKYYTIDRWISDRN